MPRSLIAAEPSGLNHVYFSVDGAVGRYAPNDRVDVLLVQLLLRIAMGGSIYWPSTSNAPAASPPAGVRVVGVVAAPKAIPIELPGPPGGTPIAIDGFCGNQTISYIEFFQQEMKRRGEQVNVDGQVQPWKGSQSYTLLLLNQALSRSSWGGPRKWNLFQNPAFPNELMYLLFSGYIPFP